MEQRDDYLQIEVRDEGAGFNLAAAAAGAPGGGVSSKFGLLNIHERIQAMGGSFTIHSTPGLGTTAKVFLRMLCRGAACA
jgi:signal transduction histidine kinase